MRKGIVFGLALVSQLTFAGFAAADDYGNGCNAAAALNVGSSRYGAIEYWGDSDYFRIYVPSSGTLTVYTTGSTDTFGTLGDSRCVTLVSNDDQPSNANFRIVRAVNAGTYYLKVRHYSPTSTGGYVVFAGFAPSGGGGTADDHGNSCATATRVTFGSPISGTIGRPGDVDFFRFDNSPSCPSCFNPVWSIFFTTGTTDTYGTVYNEYCQPLGSNDDDGPDNNFYLTASGPYGSGFYGRTFYVGVRHYSASGTGSYVLRSQGGSLF